MEDEEDDDAQGLVERDDEEPGIDEDALFEESLKARYEAAMRDGGGGPAATVKAADYIKRSQG